MLNLIILAAEADARARGTTLTRAQRTRLAELFTLHSDMVWRLLRRQGLGTAQADDGLQQVFFVAMEKLDALEKGKERSFLCASAIHVARRIGAWQEEPRPTVPDVDSNVRLDEQLDAERRKRLLADVLNALGEELRLVLVLHDIEGFSKRETAEALGIPEGTVASRTRRAREEFRAQLARRVGSGDGH